MDHCVAAMGVAGDVVAESGAASLSQTGTSSTAAYTVKPSARMEKQLLPPVEICPCGQ
jgi:hypothetical protein